MWHEIRQHLSNLACSKWTFVGIHKTCNNNLNFVFPLRQHKENDLNHMGNSGRSIEVKHCMVYCWKSFMKNRQKFDIIETISQSCVRVWNWTQQYTWCFADTKNWINNLNRIENFIVSPPIQFPFSNILFSSIHCDFCFTYFLAHSFAHICVIETSLFHFILFTHPFPLCAHFCGTPKRQRN